MESAGAKLKRIRLEKGLSLQEAHKQTKIHPNILRAIEEDGIINLSPIYIKGFLKIYCRFLGEDPKDYIPPAGTEEQPEKTPQETERKASSAPEAFKVRLDSFSRRFKLKNLSRVVLIIVFIITALLIFKAIRNSFLSWMKKPRISGSLRAKPKNIKTASAKAKTVAAAKPAINAKARLKEAASPIMLGMRFKEDSWLEVKIDGKAVLRTVVKKGRSESWQAREKIEFSLGNAASVEVEVNAKTMPALGRRGKSVKGIVTKDGLKLE